MSKILITGGAGFIGSHVCRRLLAAGRDVRVLDNFDPFYAESIKRRNVATCSEAAARPGAGRYELVEGDFRDAGTCERVVGDVDGVIHLGALAGVRPSIADPIRYMDVNVTGTQTLLEAVRARPRIPFVFASSSSVYGGNEKVPFAEDDPVDHPVSPYAASKKSGEVLCYTFHHLNGHPVTCLRFFTVYGPGQRPEMAIHLFSRKLLAGEPIPMFGDGSTRRDYTYCDDIVDGVVAALDKADGYRIYNIGGAHTTELRELIATLEDVFGRKAIIDRRPEQPGDVKQTWADTSRIRAELGFAPQTTVREGVERFAAWYLAERAAGRLA
ncbi:MAG: GDP-mannose 4,6-dehydratase [Planctomycetes bacterium]|nr:GDP-mannose 4,6-dehydratase [Planctomycetota bacterium]